MCKNLFYHMIELIQTPYVACISNVNSLSVDNSEFNMILNPGKNTDDSTSPTCLNRTASVPFTDFKNLERSPTGSRPSTSGAFKMIPLPNVLQKPAFGFSTTRNSKLGFQSIAVSFGSKVRVSVFLFADFHQLIDDRVAGAGKTILS